MDQVCESRGQLLIIACIALIYCRLFLCISGVHIVQRMYGCEWDDEAGEVTGFNHFGYDGEDYLVLDLKTDTWIAPKRQALIIKMKWDHERSLYQKDKDYITQECPQWLKKYVNYGRSSLMRKVHSEDVEL
ncbi:major histocompatibility complex class I-related gene protein-like [Stegastes partitus]|uniref:Major histocompatibility complex class I-related gene protein-like n=1 Tax=Stegastes partitus TaxID=144197 RepID=A0A9Y4TZS8_9TELE|nr:PREDICTED: major histocompatibility complex class I-related gene protein-like [Stegastes partitus]